MNARLAVLAAALFVPCVASAADLPVSYLVEEKPLKAAVAGTSLAFELYSDNTCTTLVQSVPVNVENVTVLSKLKQMTPKGDVKLPNTVELRHTLSGVGPAAARYLKVTGSGVVPVGAGCQAQGPVTAQNVVLLDAADNVVGSVDAINPCGPGNYAIVSTPVGNVAVGVRLDGFSGGCVSPEFVSNDCTGTPLMPPDAVQPIPNGFGVDGTVYIQASTGASSQLTNSFLAYAVNAGSCGCGNCTFVPPHRCCFTSSNNSFVAPAQTFTFTPPFTIELR